jgi:hypothetical protein
MHEQGRQSMSSSALPCRARNAHIATMYVCLHCCCCINVCVCVLTKQREVEKRDCSFVPCPQTPTNQKQKRKSESPPVCAPVFLIARVCFHRGPRRGWRTHMCIEPASFFIRQNEPSTLSLRQFSSETEGSSLWFLQRNAVNPSSRHGSHNGVNDKDIYFVSISTEQTGSCACSKYCQPWGGSTKQSTCQNHMHRAPIVGFKSGRFYVKVTSFVGCGLKKATTWGQNQRGMDPREPRSCDTSFVSKGVCCIESKPRTDGWVESGFCTLFDGPLVGTHTHTHARRGQQ